MNIHIDVARDLRHAVRLLLGAVVRRGLTIAPARRRGVFRCGWSVAASLIPARRAARVDPIAVLRAE
jgi:hypothetical protein